MLRRRGLPSALYVEEESLIDRFVFSLVVSPPLSVQVFDFDEGFPWYIKSLSILSKEIDSQAD